MCKCYTYITSCSDLMEMEQIIRYRTIWGTFRKNNQKIMLDAISLIYNKYMKSEFEFVSEMPALHGLLLRSSK